MTSTKMGMQKRTITITSNDELRPDVDIYVVGEIKIHFGFHPKFLSLGRVYQSGTATQSAFLYVKDIETVKVLDFTTSSPLVTARVKDNPEAEAENQYEIEVTVKPEPDAPRVNEFIIVHSNLDYEPEAKLKLSASVLLDVGVSPRSLTFDLGGEDQENSPMKTLSITNYNKALPLEILTVDDLDDYLEFTLDPVTPGEKINLTVSVKQIQRPEIPKHDGQIRIATNNPSYEEILVDYTLFWRD